MSAAVSATEGRFAIVTNAGGDAVDAASQRWARNVMQGRSKEICERSNGALTNDADANGEVVRS